MAASDFSTKKDSNPAIDELREWIGGKLGLDLIIHVNGNRTETLLSDPKTTFEYPIIKQKDCGNLLLLVLRVLMKSNFVSVSKNGVPVDIWIDEDFLLVNGAYELIISSKLGTVSDDFEVQINKHEFVFHAQSKNDLGLKIEALATKYRTPTITVPKPEVDGIAAVKEVLALNNRAWYWKHSGRIRDALPNDICMTEVYVQDDKVISKTTTYLGEVYRVEWRVEEIESVFKGKDEIIIGVETGEYYLADFIKS